MDRKRPKPSRSSGTRRSRSDLPNAQSTNYTYYANRSESNSNVGRINNPQNHETLYKKLTRKIPLLILLVVIVVVLLYSISLNSDPVVKIIGNSSQSFLQPINVYQRAATKILQSSSVNRTKITIDTVKIADQLRVEFPELQAVTIIIPLSGHQPIVEIQPSNSTLVLSNSSGSYLINQNGIAIYKIPTDQLAKFAPLPSVVDDSGLSVKIGQAILPTASITFANRVKEQFTSKNIPIQSMTLSTTPYELDVQVRGLPYYIKFDLLSNPSYSIGTYLATIKLLDSSHTVPAQYIDVRIPGRAYYK